MQECRKSGIYNVGFIDPNVIHEECVRKYPNRTENNLVMSLEGKHDRTFILLCTTSSESFHFLSHFN